jgi:hypothetical protein
MNSLTKSEGLLRVDVNIGSLPIGIADAGAEYFVVQKAIKQLESREKILKEHLMNKLDPENRKEKLDICMEGVRLLRIPRKDVRWKEAAEQIVEELVPKTRYDDAQIIINGASKDGFTNKVSASDDTNEV